QARLVIATAGQEHGTVRADRDAPHWGLVGKGLADERARGGVPQSGLASRLRVAATRDQSLAVSAINDSQDPDRMLERLADWFASGCIPSPRHAVATGRCECLAVRAKGNAINPVVVLHRLADGLPRGRVPKAAEIVFAACG